MIDKEKIKQELERLSALYKQAIANPNFASYDAMLIAKGKQRQREDTLAFINTLPEEPVSEDLEEEVKNWRHQHFHGRRDKDASGEYLERVSQIDLARHFANWQKEQMLKDAKELEVKCNMFGVPLICAIANDCKDGDKVKVIIIKEENK